MQSCAQNNSLAFTDLRQLNGIEGINGNVNIDLAVAVMGVSRTESRIMEMSSEPMEYVICSPFAPDTVPLVARNF